jgi:DnaK suppressor protein
MDPRAAGRHLANGERRRAATTAGRSVVDADLPGRAHLETLRGRLVDRLGELQAGLRAAARRRRSGEDTAGAGVFDRKDVAMQEQLSVVDERGETRHRQELGEVAAALRRFDSGTYGDCAMCDEPIVLRRLLARPAAARCADCQRIYEAAAPR